MIAKNKTDQQLWAPWALRPDLRIEVFTKPLEKSANDEREYRLIRLPNQLEAILVHDPTSDKAAASLDVAVGSLSDPYDMPGLAHFCEHLLFMGTEKYPKENDYAEFIHANGGSTNAFTAPSNTNYFFSVAAPELGGALSRFSAFFHCPLFQPSCTLRELQAVDSEHKKNAQQDSWRLFQLGKGLSRHDHPWRKFSSGNRESLLAAGRQFALKQKEEEMRLAKNSVIKGTNGNGMLTPEGLTPRSVSPAPSTNSELEPDGGAAGRETRRRLLEWWETHYCSSRMKLAVLGKESLDELTQMIAENFSPIADRNLGPAPLIETPALGPEQMGTVVFAKTIMDMNMLEVAFSIPYQQPHYEYKPAEVLTHLIGHEGPGSVHAFLKNKGWIVSLETSCPPLGRGFDAFRVTLTLTKEGLNNWRDVLVAIFNYINVLKSQPLQPYIFEEMRMLAEIRFRWKEKRRSETYVTSLSEFLQRPYPRDRLLSASTLLWGHDLVQVQKVLDGLSIHTGRVMVMSQYLTGLTPDGRWEKEKWYGTEYQVQRIEDAVISQAEGPNPLPELHVPIPNPFIPQNLDVHKTEVSSPSIRPYLIHETPNLSLWHKKDDQFWVPRGHVIIEINSKLASLTPQHAVMTRLVGDLVVDSLTEYTYAAELAGLKYSMGTTHNGLQIVVTGYNDKISQLLRTVLLSLAKLTPDSERLSVLMQQLERDLRNFNLEQPFRISDDRCRHALQHHDWTRDQLLSQLPTCDNLAVGSHIRGFLTECHVEMLVHGNIEKTEAMSLANLVESNLHLKDAPSPADRPTDLSLILPQASNYIIPMKGPNPQDVNSSLTYYCHVGDIADSKKRAALLLFANIAREPCFDQLRTKEQLGYIVSSSTWQSTGSMGWRIIVQSERDPSYVESRVDRFLEILRTKLISMTDEEFLTHKRGLITELLEKPKNLGEEVSRLWSHISSGYYDFSRRLTNVANLEKLGRGEVIDLFNSCIHPDSPMRRKLSVQCKSQRSGIVKLSVEAAEAFCGDLGLAGVEVDEATFLKLAEKEPPLEAVVAHWKGVLGQTDGLDNAMKEKLLAQLQQRAQECPVGGLAVEVNGAGGKARLPAVIIEDVEGFRKTLEVSGPAVPIEGWRAVARM